MDKPNQEETITVTTTLSDQVLLEKMGDGDTDSFETIFHRYYERVYGISFRLLGNRDEAEEVTQEVFLQFYNRALTRRFLVWQGEQKVGAWLYRVATNMGYNALRTRKRLWQRNVWLVPDPNGRPGADKEVEERQEAALVRAALARLPERQAKLLVLRQMDLSYAECAEICQVSPSSIGTLLARASTAFRRAYEDVKKGVS